MDISRTSTGKKRPWDWMSEEEQRLLGDDVVGPQQQARWCKAIVFGTLPYNAGGGRWRPDQLASMREDNPFWYPQEQTVCRRCRSC
jgi:hypothetical protein